MKDIKELNMTMTHKKDNIARIVGLKCMIYYKFR